MTVGQAQKSSTRIHKILIISVSTNRIRLTMFLYARYMLFYIFIRTSFLFHISVFATPTSYLDF